MVSLPYAEVSGRATRSGKALRREAEGRVLNWRLVVALGLNVVAWAGLARLIAYFL